jgi:hypothetical protein
LTLLLALFAAGCGGASSSAEDFDGPQREVAEVIEDLQDASADDDARRICEDILARPLVKPDCQKAVDTALKDADVYDLEVKKIEPARPTTTATAEVEAGRDGDQTERITLVREGRAWKISRLAVPPPR